MFSWHVVAGPPNKSETQIRAESFGIVLNLCSIVERKRNIKLTNISIFSI